jgi:hypothetical protein
VNIIFHNHGLIFTICCLDNQIRRVRQKSNVKQMGDMRYAYKILVRKPEGKIALGRTWRGRGDNARMDPKEIGWNGVEDRVQWWAVVNLVMNFWDP